MKEINNESSLLDGGSPFGAIYHIDTKFSSMDFTHGEQMKCQTSTRIHSNTAIRTSVSMCSPSIAQFQFLFQFSNQY